MSPAAPPRALPAVAAASPTVAIASDDVSVSRELAFAYRSRGVGPACGLENLFSGLPTTFTHLQWPEETAGWGLPRSDEEAEAILGAVRRRRSGGPVVAEVHNLVPHRQALDARGRRFWIALYAEADLIGHCSETSRNRFLALYPELAGRRHLVHPPFSYQRHLGEPPAQDREPPTRPFVLYAGATRARQEIATAVAAFRRARLPGHDLVVASRIELPGRLDRRLARAALRALPSVRLDERVLPLEGLAALFRAASAVLITRGASVNNSGILFQAIENGAPVVAPAHGSFPEHLAGTANILYEPGSADSCAEALRRLLASDLDALRRDNLALAETWGWAPAVDLYLDALGVRPAAGAAGPAR